MTIRRLLLIASLVLAAVGCSSDDGGSTAASTIPGSTVAGPSTTSATSQTLRILVTNDDGIGAEGIDALVEALDALPDVEVTVVAPAENQSGSGDRRSDEPATATEAATISGHPGTAVAGKPADAVEWALGEGAAAQRPHLVISGINEGQNLGPIVAYSGTVGAARTAAREGIPALAVSAGWVETGEGEDEGVVDYDPAVDLVLEWLAAHRDDILADGSPAAAVTVTNLNVPTCVEGELRGLVEVPIAEPVPGIDPFSVDCTSEVEDPADDVVAMNHGFAAMTEIDVESLDALVAELLG